MLALPDWLAGLLGFLTGVACGFAVRHGKLCSFGAIEDWVAAGDSRRMKVFALALLVAIVGTQGLILTGLLDPTATTFTPLEIFPVASVLAGSVLFGIGMSLVGTCAFGSLVRLGGGDLRSLIVLIVMGAVAYAALRGVLLDARLHMETWSIPLPSDMRADFVSLLTPFAGSYSRAAVTLALIIGLGVWTLSDRRLARVPRLVTAGVVLGLGVIVGWGVTGVLIDEFAAPRPQSLSYTASVAKVVFGLISSSDRLTDFVVASAFGVAVGAYLSAILKRQFHWEAFDDPREMRRHLFGAALMGFGGIVAGGCTIGQGITAGSLLALSWPLAVVGIFTGARLGIFFILEGRLPDAMRAAFPRLFRRRPSW
jgi:uncharacterized protein